MSNRRPDNKIPLKGGSQVDFIGQPNIGTYYDTELSSGITTITQAIGDLTAALRASTPQIRCLLTGPQWIMPEHSVEYRFMIAQKRVPALKWMIHASKDLIDTNWYAFLLSKLPDDIDINIQPIIEIPLNTVDLEDEGHRHRHRNDADSDRAMAGKVGYNVDLPADGASLPPPIDALHEATIRTISFFNKGHKPIAMLDILNRSNPMKYPKHIWPHEEDDVPYLSVIAFTNPEYTNWHGSI